MDTKKLENLPLEVYWRICWHVPSKSQLSLASRHMHTVTIPELFRSVKFKAEDSATLAQRFANVVKYANLIRRVTVSSSTLFTIEQAEDEMVASVIGTLDRVFSFEWNACTITLSRQILSAVLALPELIYIQTCSVPVGVQVKQMNTLKSIRLLRLRSLDEAEVVNGLIRHSPALTRLSIRVAEPNELNVDTESATMFLPVLFEGISGLDLETLALFNFARLDINYLSHCVRFENLTTLRLDSSDPFVHSAVSESLKFPSAMRTLDLTFGRSAVSYDGAPLLTVLCRDLRSVENLNLKFLCAPLAHDHVLDTIVAPLVLNLSALPFKLRKLSLHVWSISSGHYLLLAPWSLNHLDTLAHSVSGSNLRSLALDLSRNATPFQDLIDHLGPLKSLRELYVNYAPSFYYGTGIYDICRREAMALKTALPGLELIWLNSVELKMPVRKRLKGWDDQYDEHVGDEYFADDNNFHVFASRLF
ncbi:hypothetical protein V1512DRAFT_210583 [Lipomyces arxii]|uniref:uncharacterized protein n=1 Tax=Lipomyces arxii TaxID=56418 RepID=UPI0034CFEA56